MNAGWQEQISAQGTEHDRLTEQNKGLMDQINQYQVTIKEAKDRGKELLDAAKEAHSRCDTLQSDTNDMRRELEVAKIERDQLQSDMSAVASERAASEEKNARIGKLQLELENWQNRLPPLIEKYRDRNKEAEELEADLADARSRIGELCAIVEADESGSEAESSSADEEERAVDAESGSTDTLRNSRDKLQAIKGIGPAIEKTLIEMGIIRFQQIADMSEYDIDRIAKRLKGFRSRIYREDWIGQARDLRDQDSID
jgi:predicted flap endonuclease-1-like 5' DNA nuclease